MIHYPFLDLRKINLRYLDSLTAAAAKVIASGRYIGGEEVGSLEQQICDITGATHAVATGNGLDSLKLIFLALMEMGEIKRGDEVIIPANTFIASALAVVEAGLTPLFADINPDTLLLDTSRLDKIITSHTRAIMPVHLYGRVCFDEQLVSLAESRNLLLIEDAAQAIGATSRVAGLSGSYNAGALGHAAAFSFYPTKNIGALGDGGMVTTSNPRLAELVRQLGNYGTSSPYHHDLIGINSRLDPMQAAMLRIKLADMPTEIAMRRENASLYNSMLDTPLLSKRSSDSGEVYYQYVVMCNGDRNVIRSLLLDKGVETAVHYPVPVHMQKSMAPWRPAFSLPEAERTADEILSLPISSATSAAEIKEIVSIINSLPVNL